MLSDPHPKAYNNNTQLDIKTGCWVAEIEAKVVNRTAFCLSPLSPYSFLLRYHAFTLSSLYACGATFIQNIRNRKYVRVTPFKQKLQTLNQAHIYE